MLVANSSDRVELRHASQHLGSNIRTARVITEKFCKQFFVSVGSREARLDRYLWNGKLPELNTYITFTRLGRLCASNFLIRNQMRPHFLDAAQCLKIAP